MIGDPVGDKGQSVTRVKKLRDIAYGKFIWKDL